MVRLEWHAGESDFHRDAALHARGGRDASALQRGAHSIVQGFPGQIHRSQKLMFRSTPTVPFPKTMKSTYFSLLVAVSASVLWSGCASPARRIETGGRDSIT